MPAVKFGMSCKFWLKHVKYPDMRLQCQVCANICIKVTYFKNETFFTITYIKERCHRMIGGM